MVSEQDKEDISNYCQSIYSELDNKVDRPTVVIEEVIAWTFFDKYLTKKIFEYILDASEKYIAIGQEKERIEKLIKIRLIENWEFKEASGLFRQVQNKIVHSNRSKLLLELYQKILQQDDVPVNDTPEQQELIESGLVSIKAGGLRVTNRIFEQVFNQNWINENLHVNSTKSHHNNNNSVANLVEYPNNNNVANLTPEDNDRRPSDVARVFAYLFIVILGVAFVGVLLFLILKPLQPSSSSKYARSISECEKFNYEIDEALKKPEKRLDVIKKGLIWRQEQGKNLNQECNNFRKNLEQSGIYQPDIENKFNQVLRQEAQIKIDINQLEEAVDFLCKISDEYEYIQEVKGIFQRWELTRGDKIKNKINQLKSSCPAAQY